MGQHLDLDRPQPSTGYLVLVDEGVAAREDVALEHRCRVAAGMPADDGGQPAEHPSQRGLGQRDGVAAVDQADVVGRHLDIAMDGFGTLVVDDGATVTNRGFASIGTLPDFVKGGGGIGVATVRGPGSTWTVTGGDFDDGDLHVGFFGQGRLVAQAGGRVHVDGDLHLNDNTPDENGEPVASTSFGGKPLLLKFFRGHW